MTRHPLFARCIAALLPMLLLIGCGSSAASSMPDRAPPTQPDAGEFSPRRPH